MTDPSGIQIVTKPGGLSGAAHAVHILICLFTCGLWIPGYIAFIAFAPAQRIEVIAPVGTDPQLIARARASVPATPPRLYPPAKPDPGWTRTSGSGCRRSCGPRSSLASGWVWAWGSSTWRVGSSTDGR